MAAVPAARLGELIRAARQTRGMAPDELAGRLGVGLDDLSDWECGRTKASPHVVEAIAWELGTTVDGILPPRRHDAPPPTSNDQVAAFVRLVTTMRGARPGSPLRLRTPDLEQLALALGAEVTDVEGRIATLTSCTRAEAAELGRRLLRRKLLVPMQAGAYTAAALVTAGAAAQAGSAASTPTTAPPAPAPGPAAGAASRSASGPASGPGSVSGAVAAQRVADLKAQVAGLTGQLAGVQKERAAGRNEAAALAAEVSSLRRENAVLGVRLSTVTASGDGAQARLGAAERTVAELEQQLAAARADGGAAAIRLDEARAQCAELQAGHDRLSHDNKTLRAQRATLTAACAAARAELAASSTLNAALRAGLDAAGTLSSALQTGLDASNTLTAALQSGLDAQAGQPAGTTDAATAATDPGLRRLLGSTAKQGLQLQTRADAAEQALATLRTEVAAHGSSAAAQRAMTSLARRLRGLSTQAAALAAATTAAATPPTP